MILLRDDLEISTQDFFYDLFDGGYINPTKICVDAEDAKRINEAINLINEFRFSLEEMYPDFLQ